MSPRLVKLLRVAAGDAELDETDRQVVLNARLVGESGRTLLQQFDVVLEGGHRLRRAPLVPEGVSRVAVGECRHQKLAEIRFRLLGRGWLAGSGSLEPRLRLFRLALFQQMVAQQEGGLLRYRAVLGRSQF